MSLMLRDFPLRLIWPLEDLYACKTLATCRRCRDERSLEVFESIIPEKKNACLSHVYLAHKAFFLQLATQSCPGSGYVIQKIAAVFKVGSCCVKNFVASYKKNCLNHACSNIWLRFIKGNRLSLKSVAAPKGGGGRADI
jgi:hypothetical protein